MRFAVAYLVHEPWSSTRRHIPFRPTVVGDIAEVVNLPSDFSEVSHLSPMLSDSPAHESMLHQRCVAGSVQIKGQPLAQSSVYNILYIHTALEVRMKCRVVKMRRLGVVIPKYDLPNQPELRGELTIVDTRENSLNRILKLARHVSRFGDHEMVHLLYEPHILWMNEDRFVLTGFERVGESVNAVDYAQSWLCKLGLE
jgi:hypothetical protein